MGFALGFVGGVVAAYFGKKLFEKLKAKYAAAKSAIDNLAAQ